MKDKKQMNFTHLKYFAIVFLLSYPIPSISIEMNIIFDKRILSKLHHFSIHPIILYLYHNASQLEAISLDFNSHQTLIC